jgi:hypothetical protein
MQNKLWIFGDSFSTSYKTPDHWKSEYLDWKGYIPKIFSEILAEDLNLTEINLSISGSDNYTILQRVCDNVHRINPEDIIIIGWSQTGRFRLATTEGQWKHMYPMGLESLCDGEYASGLDGISKNTLIEIFCNRGTELYTKEVRSWVQLLNHTFTKNTIIHWSPFKDVLIYNNLSHFTRIETETNGKIKNWHYSEAGHIELAEEMKKLLINIKVPKRLI